MADPLLSTDRQPTAEDVGFLLDTIGRFWIAPALAAATRLGLAEIVHGGVSTAPGIAAAAGCDPTAIDRLLSALASVGVFERHADGRFGPNGKSELLRDSNPLRLGALLDVGMAGENFAAWQSFEAAVRTGRCAFELQHGVDWVEYLHDRPDRRDRFATAMTATTLGSEQALLDGYDFGSFRTVVDVGGGEASLVGGLLERHPDARGIVFDLPETVAAGTRRWAGGTVASRLEAVGGSFFDAVPAGDLYLLKQILHDWSDADAVRILRAVRRSIADGGRLAIIENLLPEAPRPHPGWGMDIIMMVTTGGRERSAAQHGVLLEEAGFRATGVAPAGPVYNVLEAVPV